VPEDDNCTTSVSGMGRIAANIIFWTKLELVTECDECPARSLDIGAITFEWNMLERTTAFMQNQALGQALF